MSKRVVGYVRVSTKEQRLGPTAQREAIEEWCAKKGYKLLSVHEDLGVSGGAAIERRPGLLQAIGYVKASGADILLVAKRDRLARDVMISAMAEAIVEREDAVILSADGVGNGEGPEAQFMRNLMSAFAQYERAIIKARTSAALAVKRDQGEVYGRVPFGYRREGKYLVPDERQEQAAQRAVELYAEIGTYAGVAKALNDEGAITPRGGRWHASSVKNLLARVKAKSEAA